MNNVTYEKEITGLLLIDPYNDFISEGGKVWDRLKSVAEGLFDIPRGIDHVILLYVGKFAEPGQIELIEMIVRKLKPAQGPKYRLVVISAPGAEPHDVIGVTVLEDSAGEFASAYAPDVGTGYVIRPDGYVGYHGRPMTEQGFFNYLGFSGVSRSAVSKRL
jgi:hypothetical protein